MTKRHFSTRNNGSPTGARPRGLKAEFSCFDNLPVCVRRALNYAHRKNDSYASRKCLQAGWTAEAVAADLLAGVAPELVNAWEGAR